MPSIKQLCLPSQHSALSAKRLVIFMQHNDKLCAIKTEESKVERLDADPPKQGTGHWDQMRRSR
jgi:hypothetical protein